MKKSKQPVRPKSARPNATTRSPASGRLPTSTKPVPSPKQATPPGSPDLIKLSKHALDAWRHAVLSIARLPRGFARQDKTDGEKVHAILKAEMKGVHELWEIFTQERGELGKFLVAGKPEAVAYLLGFHLTNYARMQLALRRIDGRSGLGALLAGNQQVRWHDFGAGSGAMTQAFLDFSTKAGLSLGRLEAHAVDVSGALLDAARTVVQATRPDFLLKTHRLALDALPVSKYSHPAGDAALAPEARTITIYGMGYVYNEITANARAQRRLAEVFSGHLERDEAALVIMLEPATQTQSRAAMEWRDGMVEQGFLPIYPCPAAIPCPLLERSRDWCFSEGSLDRPAPVIEVDRALGIDRSRFGSTILAMATPALVARLKPTGKPLAVVVGRPDRVAGNNVPAARGGRPAPVAARGARPFDFLVCTAEGLQKVPPTPGRPFLPRGATLD